MALEHSGLRELEEEVNVTTFGESPKQPRYVGLIVDRSNDVGHLHLGIVFEVEVPEDSVVEPAEEILEGQGWFTLEQLLADEKLESWSQIVARAEQAAL